MIYFSPIPLGKDVLSLGRSQLLLALIRSMLTFNQLLKPDLGGGALGFNWPRQVTWQRNGNRARFTLGGQWPESNDIHPKRRRITRGRGGGGRRWKQLILDKQTRILYSEARACNGHWTNISWPPGHKPKMSDLFSSSRDKKMCHYHKKWLVYVVRRNQKEKELAFAPTITLTGRAGEKETNRNAE